MKSNVNPWSKFRTYTTKKLTLEKFDMPELWVEITPLVAYPQRIITKATDENKDSALPMYRLCILNWNLTDTETNETLPVPKDSDGFMEQIPPMIIAWLADEIRKYNEESLPPSLMSAPSTS